MPLRSDWNYGVARKCRRCVLDGETVLRLNSCAWQAEIVASVNANMISLKHLPDGLELLRAPGSMAALRAKPEVYGIPALLPPNRIAGGEFSCNGRRYSLPVNEAGRANHIHGVLLGRPFKIEEAWEQAGNAFAKLSFMFDAHDIAFNGYPHEFKATLEYSFTAQEVSQRFSLENLSSSPMPFGLGFHTAFRVQAPDFAAEIPAGDGQWELAADTRLPTGRLIPWLDGEDFRQDGGRPVASAPVACHFPLQGTGAVHDLRLRSPSRGLEIVYSFDSAYKHCAVWNDGGGKGFVCIEPMTWMTNAPNIPSLSPLETGLQLLTPGSRWTARSSIKVMS